MEKYLREYADKFDENFPMYAFMCIPEDEVVETIKKCLDTGKPYILIVEEGVYY